MTFLGQFFMAIGSYVKAVRFIRRYNLTKVFLFPLLLNLLVLIGIVLGFGSMGNFINSFWQGLINFGDYNFFLSDYLNGFLAGVVNFLLVAFAFVMFFFVGGYVVIILMSPILSYVSEKTEHIITGNEYNFNLAQTIKDVVRGILLSIRGIALEIALLILAFFVGLIPVIGWFVPIVLFFVASYFYGFSFMDYTHERLRLSVNESVQEVRRKKGIAMGNGLIYSLLLLIPFFGMLLSAFVSIISTVAATIALQDSRLKR